MIPELGSWEDREEEEEEEGFRGVAGRPVVIRPVSIESGARGGVHTSVPSV